MAEQAGRVVADEVDVGVPVGVGERAAVALDERQWERRVVQDRARASHLEARRGPVRAAARESGLRSAVSRRIRSTTPTNALSVVIEPQYGRELCVADETGDVAAPGVTQTAPQME